LTEGVVAAAAATITEMMLLCNATAAAREVLLANNAQIRTNDTLAHHLRPLPRLPAPAKVGLIIAANKLNCVRSLRTYGAFNAPDADACAASTSLAPTAIGYFSSAAICIDEWRQQDNLFYENFHLS
jgi:hypothetical protein